MGISRSLPRWGWRWAILSGVSSARVMDSAQPIFFGEQRSTILLPQSIMQRRVKSSWRPTYTTRCRARCGLNHWENITAWSVCAETCQPRSLCLSNLHPHWRWALSSLKSCFIRICAANSARPSSCSSACPNYPLPQSKRLWNRSLNSSHFTVVCFPVWIMAIKAVISCFSGAHRSHMKMMSNGRLTLFWI